MKKIKLKAPVNWPDDKTQVEEIELREPTVKDVRDVRLAELHRLTIGESMEIASRLSTLPPSFFDRLPVEDAMSIADTVTDFLLPGHGTGRD